MQRTDVLTKLRQYRTELDDLGVKSIAVFGSVARDEATLNSDVDLLVEFNRPIGLFEFVRLKLRLEALLDQRVDLVTYDALHPALRPRILSEAIDAA